MYYLITVDADKCTGCGICELVCSLHNEKECNPEKARIRVIRSEEEGIIYTVPVVCQQCEKPLCLELCPVTALYRDPETGAVVVSEEKCIGCRLCVYVCPFGAITVDPEKHFSVKCALCDGEPRCVEFCPGEALQYVRSDKIAIREKREAVGKFLEHQRQLAGSPETMSKE